MKRCILALTALLALGAGQVQGAIFLDMETPSTGSLLGSQPLVTPYGTITFQGEFRDKDADPEFDAAGAVGDVLDIDDDTDQASLDFSFGVLSMTFIYGGNAGVFDMKAYDAGNNLVDSFYQASTWGGQPAGPTTIAAAGIRRVVWQDPGQNFAAIDNVTIEPVPEPASLIVWSLISLSFAGVGWSRRRKAA